MNLLEELEILLETRQPYANGNAEKCYPFVTELIQQLRAAQQSVQPTLLTEPVNYCNPVNGVHAPFCTGHKSQSGLYTS